MPAALENLLEDCLAVRAQGGSLEDQLAVVEPALRPELERMVVLADVFRRASRPGLSAAATSAHERRLIELTARLRGSAPIEAQTPT